MKNYIFLIILLFATLSCSDKIGTYAGMREDFLRTDKLKEYQIRPKTGEKAVFQITHENIDLSDFDMIIQGTNEKYYYYYYGPYQKKINFYLPDVDKEYCTDLIFRIINKKTNSMYDFTSDLNYCIFKTNKPIRVKLLSEYQKYDDMEINYKLTGCPNSFGENM